MQSHDGPFSAGSLNPAVDSRDGAIEIEDMRVDNRVSTDQREAEIVGSRMHDLMRPIRFPRLNSGSPPWVDFTEDLIRRSFEVDNPRAVSKCGCGTSFSPKAE